MQQCQVNDLIRDDDINIVTIDTSLRQAAERFLLSDCELLAIIDGSGQLAGVVSESSVVRALLNPAAAAVSLATLVNRHVESVRSDLSLNHVLHLFRSSCHSAIPVVDPAGQLCGLLRRRDVMHYLLSGRVDQPHTSGSPRTASHASPDISARPGSAARAESPTTPPPDAGPTTSRPYFLRGDAARERLKQTDDETRD